jgi:hypothetical protein
MKTLYFRCKLLTDVVLNQKAATEGNQESLDFIPGSNFLGIAASILYKDEEKSIQAQEKQLSLDACREIFHSGKVRFSDAHPEEDGKRALRIPASFYYPKLKKVSDICYIHHVYKKENDTENQQLKQSRSGFYIVDSEKKEMQEIRVEKSFAIKSAYDKEYRRSADEKMYGYESLQAGSTWLFEVTIENDALASKIKSALEGKKRLGRSRTAQYGLVEIKEADDYQITVESHTENKEVALVYANSRLIFLDEYGLPVFQPTAEDLGFQGGEIDWEKTQIRTFQYAPWNFKRQARDTDRCGIEKGSVIYIKNKDKSELIYPTTLYVGRYQNEGFGNVIFNPDFLKAVPNSNGKAKYKIIESKKDKEPEEMSSNEPLFKYLQKQQAKEKAEQDILEKVNDFVSDKHKGGEFKSESFASQWGTIRSIARKESDKQKLYDAIFTLPNGYIVHGVAEGKWGERSRLKIFKDFVEQIKNNSSFSDRDFQSAIINLSSEMAKISKK